MSAPNLNAEVATIAGQAKEVILSMWLVGYQGYGDINDYRDLPEQQIYGKIAEAYGGRSVNDYVSLPLLYSLSDIYNALTGGSDFHLDGELELLASILAALKGEQADLGQVALYQSLNIPTVLALIIVQETVDLTGFLLYDDGIDTGALLYDDGVDAGELALTE